MSKRYYIATFGCQMNVHESEKLAGTLESRDFLPSETIEEADVIVFNTCCIRETAESRIAGQLGSLKSIKQKNPKVILAVCGCMVQKKNTAETLKKKFPYIDIFFGTHNLSEFGGYLDAYDGNPVVEIWEHERGLTPDMPVRRANRLNAWINIMYGCNNFCSYCIVPYVRGRERSRNSSDIIQDAKRLIDEGFKELTLLGQNVNSYNANDVDFARLLDKLSALDGEFKIKFMTSHPKDLNEDVIKVMAKSDKIVDYIHLPVQAGSDRILRLMNRKYTAKQYLDKVDMIRKYMPGAGISSDVMVGFPTETEADFLETVRIVEASEYNNLFTFMYSRRSGTPGDLMTEQVDITTKRERIRRLIDRQFEIGSRLAAECVGKTFTVLCEDVEGGKGRGKTHCEREISFQADQKHKGTFVKVQVEKSKNTKLTGIIV